MYDIIGDIHGHGTELKQLLAKLDYQVVDEIWEHPENRKVIFVGDYIDRGPEIREVLQIVKGMSDSGNAIALMGNHEYNALAFAHQKEDGGFLRKHSEKNLHQHQETVKQFQPYPNEWSEYKEWFFTLSLFLEVDGIRSVHACWDADHIDWLRENKYTTLTVDLLKASHVKGSEAYTVINDTLKGKETNIPEEYAWQDKDGHWRNGNRVKWWVNLEESTYEHCIFNCPPELNDHKPSPDLKINVYPHDAPPVFFGHYWLEDHTPFLQGDNVACLDYSVAKEGNLVAYSFNGESKLDVSNFSIVKSGKE